MLVTLRTRFQLKTQNQSFYPSKKADEKRKEGGGDETRRGSEEEKQFTKMVARMTFHLSNYFKQNSSKFVEF